MNQLHAAILAEVRMVTKTPFIQSPMRRKLQLYQLQPASFGKLNTVCAQSHK